MPSAKAGRPDRIRAMHAYRPERRLGAFLAGGEVVVNFEERHRGR
jgi:hypothetical protein